MEWVNYDCFPAKTCNVLAYYRVMECSDYACFPAKTRSLLSIELGNVMGQLRPFPRQNL